MKTIEFNYNKNQTGHLIMTNNEEVFINEYFYKNLLWELKNKTGIIQSVLSYVFGNSFIEAIGRNDDEYVKINKNKLFDLMKNFNFQIENVHEISIDEFINSQYEHVKKNLLKGIEVMENYSY